ncbi:SWIB/MDM2 domain Plus-3 GYF [Euphorbia peplus]|nr:SWIB/MDM2 domain Plus-3 GYF [Euphorbia peplus]
MGRKKKKMEIDKEKLCDDCCFFCKDGGALRICDFEDCLKAYHPKCVGKDDSFLESEDHWTCSWHFCLECNRTPKFHCYCCPKAICRICFCDFEFSVIGPGVGFCNHCSMLAGVIEGVQNTDPHQGKIDFKDPETYEYFFSYYWETVKQKEGLSSIHVRRAIEQLNKDRNDKDFIDFAGDEVSSQVEDEYQPTSDNDHSNNRKRHGAMNRRKRNRGNLSARKGKVQYKKNDINGWASDLLCDFLDSIGKDTTEELSQHEVTAIVIQYCKENNLFDPVKKKKIVSDAKLKSLLGKKSVQKNSIYSLLTPHFTVNLEQSNDESEDKDVSASISCKRQRKSSSYMKPQDNEVNKVEQYKEYKHNSEDEDVSASVSCKRQRGSSSYMKPQNNEVTNVDVHQQGRFASMVAQNIKLLYLNRSLMEELLKEPETFDAKVIGSFVRVKSDPFDYLQKNSHVLVKVTGIKRMSRNDEVSKEVLLQVSNMPKGVSVCQLSNDNFSEEECKDLRQRVKDGRLERTSVIEFKERAHILHEVITKQWIVKELYRLRNLIDQANEKGWRRQYPFLDFLYVERKQLLDRPSEQSRMLHEFPEIIADETEVVLTNKQHSKKDKHENNLSPEPDSVKLSEPSAEDAGSGAHFAEHEQQDKGPESEELKQWHHTVSSHENSLLPEPDIREFSKVSTKDMGEHEQQYQVPEPEELEQHHTVSSHESNDGGIHEEVINEPSIIQVKGNHPEASHSELESGQPITSQPKSGFPNKRSNPPPVMIELSDDDDDDEEDNTIGVSNKPVEVSDDKKKDTNTIGVRKKAVDDSDSSIWYCVTPHGCKAGPYSMSLLKGQADAFSSELKFKVWKCNQSPEEAIFLTDAIRQFSGAK